jgi:hypothetical protein
VIVATHTRSTVDYALEYAKRGWHVFPCWWIQDNACACGDVSCKSPGKHPIGALVPRGHIDASIAPQRVASWWRQYPNAHIAVYLGASGLVAIDIDPRNGGDLTIEQIEQQYGALTSEVEASTGGGGRHLVYSAPSDLGGLPGKLGPGVDVKLNGYIIVEPSGHVSGGRYAWEASSDPLNGAVPSPLPDWLRGYSRPLERHEAAGVSVSRQTVIDLRSALTALRSDDRDFWVTVGHALKPLGEVGRSLFFEWSQTSEKYDARDCAEKWESFQPSRIGHEYVFARAQECGWVNPAAGRARVLEVPAYMDDIPPPDGTTDAPQDRPDGHLSPDIPRRNWLNWSALACSKAPKFEWIWQDWLSWHPTLLAGRGGIGKSLFTQQLATALATCADGMLRPNRAVRVLYWACEDDADELWRRQERICASMGMGLADLGDSLTIDARMGLENTLYTLEYGRPMWTPLLGELTQQVNDLAIDVVFLDNVGQIFGANENDRHHVTTFTNGIAGIVRGRPFCPVFLAHPAKATGSEYAGNAAWENAVRMRWLLSDRLPDAPADEEQGETEQSLRYLCKRKANYSTKDILRLRIEEGVLRPAMEPSEAFTADTGANDYLWEQRAERVVLDALDRITKMGIATSHTRGSAYLPKLILELKVGEGLGKPEIERAMLRLLTNGQIKRDQIGTYSNRSPKFGLVRV